jgi:uroporphyrinogen-III synthase
MRQRAFALLVLLETMTLTVAWVTTVPWHPPRLAHGTPSTPSIAIASTLRRRRQRRCNVIIAATAKEDSDAVSTQTIHIAVTREAGKNDKLAAAIAATQLNIVLHELPCIAHAHGPDYHRLRDTLLQREAWGYVTVTSPEAARVLASCWPWKKDDTLNDNNQLTIPKVAAVGKATEQALGEAGIAVAFCPTKATAETLVQELPWNPGKGQAALGQSLDDTIALSSSRPAPPPRVLYPASAKAANTLVDGLQARGFAVTRLDTYDTVTATWSQADGDLATSCRIACFGSPSAVKGWIHNYPAADTATSTADALNGGPTSVLAACIGETSAKACRALGWPEERIFAAQQPGMDGWVSAVIEAVAAASREGDSAGTSSSVSVATASKDDTR